MSTWGNKMYWYKIIFSGISIWYSISGEELKLIKVVLKFLVQHEILKILKVVQ